MNEPGDYQKLINDIKAFRKRQRRFQIEILIAACFICLVLGFVAGAGWQYMKEKGEEWITEDDRAEGAELFLERGL